jgi:Tfp pilus assembly protein PilN
MINLLPDERKREIRAARLNVVLLRYNFIAIATVALIAAAYAGFYVVLQGNQQKAEALINENAQKASSLSSGNQEAEEYRRNLAIASQILANNISYTDALIAVTKLLPPGTVLDHISLSANSLNQQTEFQIHATSYDTALKLTDSFQKSDIFDNVYFETLTAADAATRVSANYPVDVLISAKLNKKVLTP